MRNVIDRLDVPKRLLLAYVVVYIPLGFTMNAIGQYAEIAMFANWWQVLTCYGLYLIPASIVCRTKPAFDQYLWGLLVLGLLEICGYAFETSIAFQCNIIDTLLGERNFSLAMTLFFAAFIPTGNWLAAQTSERLWAPSLARRATH